MHVQPLKVHHAGSAGDGNLATMLKEQLAPGRPRQCTADINQGGRLAAVLIDNHPTAQQDVSNNDTGANDSNSDTKVTAEHTTEARVISIREV